MREFDVEHAVKLIQHYFKGMSREEIFDLPVDIFLSYVPWDELKEAEKAGGFSFQSWDEAEAWMKMVEGG